MNIESQKAAIRKRARIVTDLWRRDRTAEARTAMELAARELGAIENGQAPAEPDEPYDYGEPITGEQILLRAAEHDFVMQAAIIGLYVETLA